MRNHIRSFFVYVGVGMLLLTGLESFGQTNTLTKHNWYFGNTPRSIRFNRVTDEASLVANKAVPFGTGGTAVATDRGNGNLLFYTNGGRIFDSNHNPMPNGGGLNGNINANQPAAICPVPGQPDKFYVFTNTADFSGGNISYTVVDMKLYGASAFPSPAFGDVESKNNPLPILTGVAEGMITLPHQNGTDFWLITQAANSRVFNATLINAATYTSGTFTTVASNGSNLPITIGHMAYHETLRKLAAAPQEASTDAIILNFNEANGQLDPDRVIANSAVLATTNQAIYDMEWSASGQYLYLSRHGEPGVPADVLQYDYTNRAITLASVLPSPVFRSYGLQRGPDNFIYHLFQRTSSTDPFLLGRIENPDSLASRAAYTAAPGAFANLDFGGKQFPQFLPKDTIDLRLNFTSAGLCQNSPTSFFPFVRPGADSLQWDFADGNFGAGWAPIHTYETAGSFPVTLRAFYQGQVDSVTRSVVINAFALQLQMTEDTTACRQEFPPPRGSATDENRFRVKVNVQGGTPASIVWSNGDLGETLMPDSAGYYYVVVTDASGCSAYAGVNVREYGLQDQKFNKWYFGDKAGIDFNVQPPQALNESAMLAPEGCSIVCDRNGQTIFYTDGHYVYDKTHTEITGGTGIGGTPSSTQSALIVPLPGDETLYYIFTTQAINGSDSLQLDYSLFDLKLNDGKGAVVMRNVMLFMKSTERITANGQWLIVHELGNKTFRSYPITAQGIGNQVYSAIGSDHSLAIQQNGEGYMKLGPRNMVAVPVSTPGTSNHIEIFQLDTAGVISNYQDVDLQEPNGAIYGIEFSPAGNKLFASVRYTGGTSALYEYSIDSLFRIRRRQRLPVAADIGAIQVGPDGQIYVATNSAANNTQLGTIAANEDTLATSSFNLQGFALASGTVSRLGLPNFIQINSNALGGPGITVAGRCLGDSTRFSGSPRDQIDTYTWTVNRINPTTGTPELVGSSTEATFALLLAEPGDYTVSMELRNRCDVPLILSDRFTITAPPVNPGRGVPICNTPTVALDANPSNVPGLTYEWDTGETTEIINIGDQGVYTVAVSDTLGCITTGTFLAADSRPIFDLGPDITICEDNNTPALNVNNPGMTYAWTINSAPASTTAVQSIDVNNPGVFTYQVTVTDPVTSCARTEDKTYTINVSPRFALVATNPSNCGLADGAVTVNLAVSTPAGGPLYSYFISGPGGSLTDFDQTAPNSFTLNNVSAGTFSATVQDQISECTISQTIGLSDANYTASAVHLPPNCDPVPIRVTSTIPGPDLPL
jgi:hypothetical protein